MTNPLQVCLTSEDLPLVNKRRTEKQKAGETVPWHNNSITGSQFTYGFTYIYLKLLYLLISSSIIIICIIKNVIVIKILKQQNHIFNRIVNICVKFNWI